MSSDRSVRSLSGLGAASSNRVLNLLAIAEANAENDAHRNAPMFVSPILNSSLILKHRLRADEVDFFSARRALATKIIIPFERSDLKFGGRSLFIGQRGFEDMLQEAVNYREKKDMRRDLDVLRLIDNVPSLDPFLLREHLRNNSIEVSPSYFTISDGDQTRMHAFVSQEMSQLVMLAGGSGESSNKLVTAMLSNQIDEKLEPLRLTLGLTGHTAVDQLSKDVLRRVT